jgi:cation transport ATPase
MREESPNMISNCMPIKINLIFSMMLNFVAIALAITRILNPVVGALVHDLGSMLVSVNSALLLKWSLC